jgi:hypothetical protein
MKAVSASSRKMSRSQPSDTTTSCAWSLRSLKRVMPGRPAVFELQGDAAFSDRGCHRDIRQIRFHGRSRITGNGRAAAQDALRG